MSGELSTPITWWPRAASSSEKRPVPHAASTATPAGIGSTISFTTGSSKSKAELRPSS
jgi:hypothetical protein